MPQWIDKIIDEASSDVASRRPLWLQDLKYRCGYKCSVRTTEDASQTDLVGERNYNGRVGAANEVSREHFVRPRWM